MEKMLGNMVYEMGMNKIEEDTKGSLRNDNGFVSHTYGNASKNVDFESPEKTFEAFNKYLGDNAQEFYKDLLVTDLLKCIFNEQRHDKGAPYYEHGDLAASFCKCMQRGVASEFDSIRREFFNSTAMGRDYEQTIDKYVFSSVPGSNVFRAAAIKMCQDVEKGIIDGVATGTEGISHIDFESDFDALKAFNEYLGEDFAPVYYERFMESENNRAENKKDFNGYEFGDMCIAFWHDMMRGDKSEFEMIEREYDMKQMLWHGVANEKTNENSANAVLSLKEDSTLVVRLNDDIDLHIGKSTQGYVIDFVKDREELDDISLLNSVTVWEDDYAISQHENSNLENEDEDFIRHQKTFYNLFSISSLNVIIANDIDEYVNNDYNNIDSKYCYEHLYDKHKILHDVIEHRYCDIVDNMYENVRDFTAAEVRKVIEGNSAEKISNDNNGLYMSNVKDLFASVMKPGALRQLVEEEVENALNNNFEHCMVDSEEAKKIDVDAICNGVINEYRAAFFDELYDALYDYTEKAVDEYIDSKEAKAMEDDGIER